MLAVRWPRAAPGGSAVGDDKNTAGTPDGDAESIPLSPGRYSRRMRLILPSTNESLNTAVTRCLEMAEQCGFSEDERTDLEIALREAMANAIIHGNKRANGSSFFVRCYGAPNDGLLILVRDQGEGFAPEDVPDPRNGNRLHLSHGRGLFLMKRLVDRLEFRRGGREVLLFKNC
jgi:serine/threonine-protein kinase RsbW